MKNDILNKAQNDPAYSQIVQLYSGLFDTQDERESFILDVAEEDVLLAAECKTSSVEGEERIINIISYNCLQNTDLKNLLSNKALALIELDKLEDFNKLLIQGKNPSKTTKKIISKIFDNSVNEEKILRIFNSISSQEELKGKYIIIDWFVHTIIENRIKIKENTNILNYLISHKLFRLLFKIIKFMNIEVKDIEEYHKIFEFIEEFVSDEEKEVINKSDISKISALNNLLHFHKNYIRNELLEKLVLKLINLKGFDNKRPKLIAEIIIFSEMQDKNVISEAIKSFERINSTKSNKYIEAIQQNQISILQIANFNDFLKYIEVNCSIIEITSTHIFVKIQGDNRPASIYMGELSNKRIDNIFDFEYNGEKIHVGMKLIAKVIRIDEKFGIQLSLRQVK